ncbi:MAG: putative HAD-hydrolase [Methanosaeta sp. PtaU1.Bin028]|nr:MAG: putative HAD-hydrolase [Methanosaeta sp. PtaU1.Bin028]
MREVISFDMDGTLVSSRFVDLVWMEGMPRLYAERHGLDFPAAKEMVIGEYMKVGSDRLEWYDMQYWMDRFDLRMKKEDLLDIYSDEIQLFPEVEEALEALSGFDLVVTSNAAREFIEVELDSLMDWFDHVFSATSDFRDVKKSSSVYRRVCRDLGRSPVEVLHIGDHYVYDYEAPLEAGLDALFLDRKGNCSGSEVVGDLREAADLILNS